MRKRNCEVRLRLNESEYSSLMKKVKATGMPREAYLRLILNGKIPVVIPPDVFYEVHSELCRIGNNLNQIAFRAQAFKMIDAPSYSENANKLFDICYKLIEATHPIRS